MAGIIKYGPLSAKTAISLMKNFGTGLVLGAILIWYNYTNENLTSQLAQAKQDLVQYKLQQAQLALQNQINFDKAQDAANKVFQQQVIDSINAINVGNTKIDTQLNSDNSFTNGLITDIEKSKTDADAEKYLNKLNMYQNCISSNFYTDLNCSSN